MAPFLSALCKQNSHYHQYNATRFYSRSRHFNISDVAVAVNPGGITEELEAFDQDIETFPICNPYEPSASCRITQSPSRPPPSCHSNGEINHDDPAFWKPGPRMDNPQPDLFPSVEQQTSHNLPPPVLIFSAFPADTISPVLSGQSSLWTLQLNLPDPRYRLHLSQLRKYSPTDSVPRDRPKRLDNPQGDRHQVEFLGKPCSLGCEAVNSHDQHQLNETGRPVQTRDGIDLIGPERFEPHYLLCHECGTWMTSFVGANPNLAAGLPRLLTTPNEDMEGLYRRACPHCVNPRARMTQETKMLFHPAWWRETWRRGSGARTGCTERRPRRECRVHSRSDPRSALGLSAKHVCEERW
ncbi:hypothetical protein B0T22DRAFT_507012 [Podospora appendiculata]|uniref:Uncharacterized protein n=1 Tax=Podospora appendiculata TaxID=314037 RepID=A0AAE0XJ67_9PEZI|nr:hypothetical protein B0T22DRAFT_507012 [Podospora appendiculata]